MSLFSKARIRIGPSNGFTCNFPHRIAHVYFSSSPLPLLAPHNIATIIPVWNADPDLCDITGKIFHKKRALFSQLRDLRRVADLGRFHTGEVYTVDSTQTTVPAVPLFMCGVVPMFRAQYCTAAENSLHLLVRRVLTQVSQ